MDGTLSVRKISGAWAATTPDGSALSINPATYGIPEATAYAAANGNLPLFIYGLGDAEPFNFSDYTLQLPPGVGAQMHCYGCFFKFDNTGTTKPGIQMDTLSYNAFINTGGRIAYAGDGIGVLIKPESGIPSGASPVPITKWSRNGSYDLGTVFATGGSPEGLVCIDVTAGAIYDPVTDPYGFNITAFVANLANGLRFVGEGYGLARHGLVVRSPVMPRQLASQNKFQFYIESCTVSEIKMGGDAGGVDGPTIGTNILIGTVSHQIGGAGHENDRAIECNGAMNQFYANAINIESSGANYNVRFGPQSYGNNIATRQMFGGVLGLVEDLNTDATNPNTFTLGEPQAFNQIGTTGEPFTVNIDAGTYLYIDRSWRVPNGRTVTALGKFAAQPVAARIQLLRRDGDGAYTFIDEVTFSHAGGGWQDSGLGTPFTVPSDGLEYLLGDYTTSGVVQTMIDNKARALSTVPIAGSVTGVVEEAPHVQWYVIPVRATYQ
jgi:hypothetical protein